MFGLNWDTRTSVLPGPIDDGSLVPSDLPSPDAKWEEVQAFALTFDGYKHHESFAECAAIANERRNASLSDLRTCLFFEQRRWRHQGEEPSGEGLAYVRSLIERIRKHVMNRRPDGKSARLVLKPVAYCDLNARQKENYNYLKVSAVLADYGFMTMRLSDGWQGADFIAQHVDGGTFLKVQLKARLAFGEKYKGKDLYIAFCSEGEWYLFPHDELLDRVLAETSVGGTVSWSQRGGYSFASLSEQMRELLKPYKIGFEHGTS